MRSAREGKEGDDQRAGGRTHRRRLAASGFRITTPLSPLTLNLNSVSTPLCPSVRVRPSISPSLSREFHKQLMLLCLV